MTFWNLLVVLCFAVLYVAVVLVYLQLRRLRDELKIQHGASRFPEPLSPQAGGDPEKAAKACAEDVRQGLAELGRRLERAIDELPAQLQPELDAIQRQLRFLERRTNMAGSGGVSAPAGGDSTTTGGSGDKNEAYKEARLLLANGVDEERVIAETGLTVEEVSLLKSLMKRPNK